MIHVTNTIQIPEKEIDFTAIRAQGAGGQNVNKVSTAVQLRFDIRTSSLPDLYKERLLQVRDRRITNEGVIVIKAQSYRTQEQNKEDALARLIAFIRQAGYQQKKRTPTKPSRAAKQRRLDTKTRKSRTKSMRKKVDY